MKLIMIILTIGVLSACDRVEEAREMDEVNFERQEEFDEKDFQDKQVLPTKKGSQIDTKDAPWPDGEVDD
jgi:translation elongation factor EF-Tu-like GTPase